MCRYPLKEVEFFQSPPLSPDSHLQCVLDFVTHVQRMEYRNRKPTNFTVETPSKYGLQQMIKVSTNKTCHMVT